MFRISSVKKMLKHRSETEKKGDKIYGGGPCKLVMTEPSTYRQVIQHYYYLTNIVGYPSAEFGRVIQQIGNLLKYIWLKVNPRLPLLKNKTIYRKVKNLLTLVKEINQQHAKVHAKSNLDAKLDKLFDISACTCSLDVVPCSDRRVHCVIDKCVQKHIICICHENAMVPIEDRAYLRDQRSKTGPKKTYHLSSVDQTSAEREVLQKEVLPQENVKLLGHSKVPTKSLEHTNNSSNNEREDTCKIKKKPTEDYNILKLPRYAMELDRSKCSSNLGAALACALLHDIKHLLRPEVDINGAKAQIKALCENVGLCENTQFNHVGMDGKVHQNTLTYKEIQLHNGESVAKNTECPSYLLDNIKTEVEVVEEVVDDYCGASSEEFVIDTQDERVSSPQNSSNSSCDADSSLSTTENSWIDLQTLLSKSRILSCNNNTGFSLAIPEISIPQREKRCRSKLSTETKYLRKRAQNKVSSCRYRAKKRLEREQLDQMLRDEQERNSQLKQEFERLSREASDIEKILKILISPKWVAPSYSSD